MNDRSSLRRLDGMMFLSGGAVSPRSMRRSALGALAVLGSSLPIMVGGCESATEPPEAVLSARDAFALDIAQIVCDAAAPCCTDQALEAPGEGCATTMRNEVFISLLTAEDEKQAVALDESEACLDAYRQATAEASCDALPHPRELQQRCPMLFGAIPVGHLGPGELCEHVYDCAAPPEGERNCFRTNFNEAPHCVWIVPVASGGTCSAPAGVYMVCPDGEGCLPNEAETDLVCTTASQEGEPCVANNSCAAGLACDIAGDTCEQPRQIGEYCGDWPDGCVPEAFCADDATCNKLPILAACENGGCETQLDAYCDP